MQNPRERRPRVGPFSTFPLFLIVWLCVLAPIVRTYRAQSCSWASFYIKIANILLYFLPLITIFLTQGLWKKTGTFREIPRISFNGDFIAFGYGHHGSILASSYSVLNSAANPNQLSTARISHYSTLHENENAPNTRSQTLHLDFEMSTQNMTVTNLNYAFLLRVQMDYHSLVDMQLMLSDTIQISNTPSSEIIINARLDIDQSYPLRHTEDWKSIDATRQDVSHFQYFSVLERELNAPFSLEMKRKSSIFVSTQATNPAPDTFSISLNLFIGEIDFIYLTSFWELIKWFWIQYFAAYVVFKQIINSLTSHFFQNRIFNVYTSEQYAKIK